MARMGGGSRSRCSRRRERKRDSRAGAPLPLRAAAAAGDAILAGGVGLLLPPPPLVVLLLLSLVVEFVAAAAAGRRRCASRLPPGVAAAKHCPRPGPALLAAREGSLGGCCLAAGQCVQLVALKLDQLQAKATGTGMRQGHQRLGQAWLHLGRVAARERKPSEQVRGGRREAGRRRTCCSRSISMIRGTTRMRKVVPAIQLALPAAVGMGDSNGAGQPQGRPGRQAAAAVRPPAPHRRASQPRPADRAEAYGSRPSAWLLRPRPAEEG